MKVMRVEQKAWIKCGNLYRYTNRIFGGNSTAIIEDLVIGLCPILIVPFFSCFILFVANNFLFVGHLYCQRIFLTSLIVINWIC